jgi:hypothetical protein
MCGGPVTVTAQWPRTGRSDVIAITVAWFRQANLADVHRRDELTCPSRKYLAVL